MLVRAFASGFYKKIHFIILKVTLSFISYNFTIHSTFQLFYFSIQYIKIIYLLNKIYNPKVIQRERKVIQGEREREREREKLIKYGVQVLQVAIVSSYM